MSNLTIGQIAPILSSRSFDLADFIGKTNIVLYFYPKDDTPGCTIEAKEFSEQTQVFQSLGTKVFGVSKDSQTSHDKFKNKYCLQFDLISDDADFCQKYGVWVEKSMFGKSYMGIERTTFLIDKQGNIAHIWSKVKVNDHALEVIDKIKQLGL